MLDKQMLSLLSELSAGLDNNLKGEDVILMVR